MEDTSTVIRKMRRRQSTLVLLFPCFIVHVMIPNCALLPQVAQVESFQLPTKKAKKSKGGLDRYPTASQPLAMSLIAYLSSEYPSNDDQLRSRFNTVYDDQEQRTDSWKDLWGVERHSSHSFPFPLTVSTLAEQIVSSVRAAMGGKQADVPQVNPNVVQNAMIGDRALGRRPVRHPIYDAGRIGIEIDGPVNVSYVALMVAIKASSSPQQQDANHHDNIPVALYFNSVRETLEARQMIQYLRKQAGTNNNGFSNVEIFSLADGRLPATMIRETKTTGRERKRPLPHKQKGMIDGSKGILLVIQPTKSVMDLQRLVAQATLEGLPVVLLSPRMTRELTTPWDQSGYQLASAYGGEEPPTGPTPWLMRDFWPPVYSWILTLDEYFGYTHSILHQKQSWDIFDCSKIRRIGVGDAQCDYLASTVNCAGRPTQALLRKIAKEYQHHTA